ncbi:hypothetical protein NPN23_24990, partial [Vibrio parahaemolyticus]|nr:hypothetical protein [Vibrio parahaemolyticus]
RIVVYGYSPEDAFTLDGISKPLTVEGGDFSSKAAAAEAYGGSPAVGLAGGGGGSRLVGG